MKDDLVIVVLGGLVGGTFWLITQVLGADTFAIPGGMYAYGLLGGVLAAGAAAYIPDDVDLTNHKRLLFVSALAGLSFPAVINTAVSADDLAAIRDTSKKIDAGVEDVKTQLKEGTAAPGEISNNFEEASAAVKSGTAKPEKVGQLESVGRQALDSLTKDASKDPTEYVKAIENIGATTPGLKLESTAKLIELANSDNSSVAAAAKPAKDRNVAALPEKLQDAVSDSDQKAVSDSAQEAASDTTQTSGE